MSKQFDAALNAIKEKVVNMGELAQEMIRTTMKSLVERDPALIPRVEELEDQVDRFQVEIDEDVIQLMAKFEPVASDLRFALMVARINTELERIGDQCTNMCESISLLLSEPELKELIDLPRMAELAASMVRDSLQAFAEGDTANARQVINSDSMVDALNDQLFKDLLGYMTRDASTATRALALLLIARSLERVADHATNVSEEVIYMVKGEDVRHQSVRVAAES